MLALWLGAATAASAAAMEPAGGGPAPGVTPGPCLSEAQRAEIRDRLRTAVTALTADGVLPPASPQAPPALVWPLAATLWDPGYHGISNFVDQNPANPGSILDYNCGARTYDVAGYNHRGIDFFTWPFSWYRMAHEQVHIVAAAPGTIIGKDDGNPDQSCSTSGGNWNAVYVQHADGSTAWYGHMKKNSLTAKPVGAAVAAGEYLGVVGSSGNSTGPHLHFELYDASSNLVEPYAGPCNALNAASWWLSQRPYHDSAVNAVRTHGAPPVFPACPAVETPNEDANFQPGQQVYFAAYYRDQLQGQMAGYRVRRPDGTIQWSWNHASSAAHYAASYWYWWFTLSAGAPLGRWTFEVEFQGETVVRDFFVTTTLDAPGVEPVLALTARALADGAVSLAFTLPDAGLAALRVFDVTGREAAVLADGAFPAGTREILWRPPSSGVYFARIDAGGRVRHAKFVATR